MEQFDQLLTCAICLDRYRNPKLLPCQHSFCMEPCMEGLVDYVRRQVKCPECRAEHRIPYQGVQGFPTNVTLQRFLELHIEITGELPDPTSGQVMERCNVCSEKAYCTLCAHCEKKVCSDCKDAHMDVLKREIARINNQVRRTVHRLQDVLALIEKNTLQLQQNCSSVTEEIDEIYRRLTKALKDRMEFLKGEIERYLSTEFRNLTTLKDNLEQEISNIQSNCELAEKHMTENCSSNWDDCELMDTKDIFLKTVDFIRSFDYEVGDYSRRARFSVTPDPNQLVNTLATYGDLTINVPALSGANIMAPPALGPGLMRSKSDHRLAAQFRQKEERGLYPYGGEEENSGRTSPLGGRRFGERYGNNRERHTHDSSRYGNRSEYSGDYEGPYDSDSRKSRFRSRFTRHLPETGDSDNEPTTGRTVRFSEQQEDPKRKERERVLDTEDVGRGPLSGISRLFDSPRVIKRLQEPELKEKKKDKEPAPKSPKVNQPPPWRRQVSEDDEISKIKKQNKEQAQTETPPRTVDRVSSLRQEEAKTETVRQRKTSTSQLEEKCDDNGRGSHPVTPTSEKPRHLPASRQSSGQHETPKQEPTSPDSDDGTVTNIRRRPVSSSNKPEEPEVPAVSKWHGNQSTAPTKPYSRTSSGSSVNLEEVDGTKGRLSQEILKPRSNSSDSASSESSASSSHNTGAVFSTDEVKQRYLSNIKEQPGAKHSSDKDTSGASTPQSRYSSASSTTRGDTAERKDSISSVTSPTTRTSGSTRFQSRFLGRAATPTAEASKESESSSSESEDTSSASESEQTTTKEKVTGRTADKEIEKSDIGPLLARSANARDTSYSDRTKKEEPYTTPYSRSRGSVSATTGSSYTKPEERDSPYKSRYSTRERDSDRSDVYSNRDRDYSTRDKDYSALARSRTGSTLYGKKEEESSRYPLTSKYLSRSKTSTPDEEAPATSRYGGGGYKSRFLNRSKSSAAIGPEKEEEEEEEKPAKKISGDEKYPSGRSRYAALKERRSRLARSRSSHDLGLPDDDDPDNQETPTTYRYGGAKTSNLKSRESSPDRTNGVADKDAASLSSWARYLKNKYGSRSKESGITPSTSASGQQMPRSRSSQSVGLPSRTASIESSDDDQKNSPTSPTSPTTAGFGNLPRNQYLQKRRLLFKIGSRGSEPGCFTWPRGIAVGPDNYIVVADSSNHRIQVFDPSGNFHKEFGTYGNAEGEFDCLAGVAINRIGQYIIADRYNHRIQVFDPSGRFLRTFGSQGTADGRFNYPWGITTDALGFIYVCDKENHRVQVFQSDGTFVGKFGNMGNKPGQLEHPHYIAVSSTNRVIVSDSNNHRIQIFDVNGKVLTTFGSEGSEEGQFKFPRGVAVDDQGYIFVGDSGNNRIQIFHPDGTFLRAFGCWGSGDGEFKGLEGIAVMPNGNILLCDRENHRIQVF